MKSIIPYFGGKSRIADDIWAAFGSPDHYIEPFAGSLAVLLARPTAPKTETVNDIDGLLVNFWRAVKADPGAVAEHADYPVSEMDLHARHRWLIARKPDLAAALAADPDHYDARAAGWYAWGLSQWIGGGWGRTESARRPTLALPNGRGTTAMRANGDMRQRIDDVSDRLKNVRILCGHWSRVVKPVVLHHRDATAAVFLDPPYSHDVRNGEIYGEEDGTVAAECREWALAHGNDPRLRIALCGFEGEHDMPRDWSIIRWSSSGANNQKGTRGATDRHKERVWLSPSCSQSQMTLFGGG